MYWSMILGKAAFHEKCAFSYKLLLWLFSLSSHVTGLERSCLGNLSVMEKEGGRSCTSAK